jgi:hypothetical protein
MTHEVATRNPKVQLNRAPATRLARQIGVLSRHWVDAEFAGMEMEISGEKGMTDRRFAIVKSYLVNNLGLKMYIETRVNAKRHPLQFHHLPVQDAQSIADAIAMLTQFELDQGVGDAIRELGHQHHPYPRGEVPDKQEGTYTYAEADEMGLVYVDRNHEERALAWISEEWVTVAMWDRECRELDGHGDTRLPAHIEKLKDKGYAISTELIENSGPADRPIARYRYFTDEVLRAEWFEKHRVQEALKAKDAQCLKDAKAQSKADAAADAYLAIERKHQAQQKKVADGAKRRAANSLTKKTLAGGSPYGGWKGKGFGQAPAAAPLQRQQPIFKASRPLVATAPPAHLNDRIASIHSGYGGPTAESMAAVAGGKPPVIEVASAEGIPAAELNQQFPRAKSKDVVELAGERFVRRWLPTKVGEAVVRWNTSWARA